MKVFTKSLFLITLGFNSFFIKESEASSLIAAAKARRQAEQAIIQQQPIVQQPQEVEEQRSEEVEQKHLEPIIERMDRIQNEQQEQWFFIHNNLNTRIGALEQKVDAMDKKLDLILNRFSYFIEEVLLTL